jgi:DNA-binding response OmpR family regulator
MARIAIAEDDQTMVTLLTTLLKMDGFDVRPVDADEDVSAVVEREMPDVLVLDVHLSRQNGLDILDAIRRSDIARNAHIIMISGLNMKEECMRHGADDFLLKPFMPDDLLKLLRKNVKSA